MRIRERGEGCKGPGHLVEEEEVPLLGLRALSQHHGALEDRLCLLGGQVQLLEGHCRRQAFPGWKRVGMSL